MPGDVGIFVEQIYKWFLSVLSYASRLPRWTSFVEQMLIFLAVAHHLIGLEEDY